MIHYGLLFLGVLDSFSGFAISRNSKICQKYFNENQFLIFRTLSKTYTQVTPLKSFTSKVRRLLEDCYQSV